MDIYWIMAGGGLILIAGTLYLAYVVWRQDRAAH